MPFPGFACLLGVGLVVRRVRVESGAVLAPAIEEAFEFAVEEREEVLAFPHPPTARVTESEDRHALGGDLLVAASTSERCRTMRDQTSSSSMR
jgi:hypothetical protein